MRTLLIEDEARIVSFVQRALHADGIDCVSCADGETGLQTALAETFDVVILDLMLPERNGLSVLQELRAVKPSLPVLILSARSDLETKLRGFELGATDYLPKPFSIDELIARVRVQASRGSTETTLLPVGDMELDIVRRQARSQDTTVDLSDREFALLHCLANAGGEIVSRQQLLTDVWGYEFDPGTNVVDVCVRRLRKKLGEASPITTTRNAGYSVPLATPAAR